MRPLRGPINTQSIRESRSPPSSKISVSGGEAAILSVLNPATEGARVDRRAWNVGDGRIKLLAYKPKKDEKQKGKEQEKDNVTEQNALSTVADV